MNQWLAGRRTLLITVTLLAAVVVIAILLPTATARLVFLIPLAIFAVVTGVVSFVLRFGPDHAPHV